MSHMRLTALSPFPAAVVALVVAVACAPSKPPEGPVPSSLAKADPIVVAVQPTPAGVRVVTSITPPDVAGDTILALARASRQIARAVQAKVPDLPPGAKTITVSLYGTDVDKFGKRAFGKMIDTDFDVDSLRQIDLAKTGPAAVLNTATDLRANPSGDVAAAAWCMRYPHVGGDWCTMAGN
jgi:hypothetical protein